LLLLAAVVAAHGLAAVVVLVVIARLLLANRLAAAQGPSHPLPLFPVSRTQSLLALAASETGLCLRAIQPLGRTETTRRLRQSPLSAVVVAALTLWRQLAQAALVAAVSQHQAASGLARQGKALLVEAVQHLQPLLQAVAVAQHRQALLGQTATVAQGVKAETALPHLLRAHLSRERAVAVAL
jgi:hypothetical protein